MYLLFAGDSYYPCGGWRDFVGAFPSIESAVEYVNTVDCDWWHVVLGNGIVRSGHK